MTLTQSWLRQPQKLWLRKALFQVHLWSGVALGIYTVVVCASGSAVVFRTDIENTLSARTEVQNTGTLLTREQLKQSAQRLYPDFVIRSINRGRFATEATEIQMTRGWREKRRLFNPFTGQDIGPSPSVLFWWLRVMGDLHGNLMLGPPGLTANGVGGALVSVLCLSGIVIWWPGLANWRRSLWVRGNVGWKRLNWDLHSAFGIWTFAILLMWGVTGAYFIFPEPFRAVINYFTPIYPTRAQLLAFSQQQAPAQASASAATPGANVAPSPFRRRRRPRTKGEKILMGFSAAHYGNFAGWPMKVLWVLLGFAPAVLFVTGMIMWWNRVLSPAARRLRRDSSQIRDRDVENVPQNLVT